tara:strand:- start:552 stop:1547 length:996 start_codon:yes stop_codon:yes gene_type:complete
LKIQLDPLREDLIEWTASIWNDDVGAFPNVPGKEPTLEGSTFAAYILYTIDALEGEGYDQARWVAWLSAQQSEKDGSFSFPPPIGTGMPRKGIALWSAVRALNILSSEVARFPAYQKPVMTVDGLKEWFETWKAWGDSHHEVLALVPTLSSHPNPEWVEAFFAELADQQHPTQGFWPRGDKPVNISRTFAYSLIHIGMGRLPPQSDRIVDTMLDLQGADGFWHGRPGFSTMDAVFLLVRLPGKIGWREDDAEVALTRTLNAVMSHHEENASRDCSDVHQYAAVVQTIGLLAEALQDRFESSHRWRFSWDRRENWACPAIARELSGEGPGRF